MVQNRNFPYATVHPHFTSPTHQHTYTCNNNIDWSVLKSPHVLFTQWAYSHKYDSYFLSYSVLHKGFSLYVYCSHICCTVTPTVVFPLYYADISNLVNVHSDPCASSTSQLHWILFYWRLFIVPAAWVITNLETAPSLLEFKFVNLRLKTEPQGTKCCLLYTSLTYSFICGHTKRSHHTPDIHWQYNITLPHFDNIHFLVFNIQ